MGNANGRQLAEQLSFADNNVDNVIDFITFRPVRAQTARITILPSTNGIRHSISELTVFARPIPPKN